MIFLDLDGVLADIDKALNEVLGTDNHYKFEYVYGPAEMWSRINAKPDFWLSMPMMADAPLLLRALEGLQVTILTALPKTNSELVDAHKRQWVRENIGNIPLITCSTYDKPLHCLPGSALVDDRAVNETQWRARGGHYVIHTDAESSIRKLRDLGVI